MWGSPAVWIEVTARAQRPVYGCPTPVQFRATDGQVEEHRLAICDVVATERFLWRLEALPSVIEAPEAAQTMELSFRPVGERTARLSMVRQLSADDPFTRYDNPLELQRELEHSGVKAGERVWLRYRRYLQERQRPLFAGHPLSSRHYPLGLRSEQEAVEMIRWLAPLANQGAPPEAPLVTVIVPCYGQLPVTLRCLESLLAERTYQSRSLCRVELVVLDDASPDDSGAQLATLDGLGPIRVLRNEENLGFLRTCNRGAALAEGSYLCFLNNDTVVTHGWLEELVRSFRLFPGAGLVGSMLLYPDGRLQEAGGIVWRDGSAWNYGRGSDPSSPEVRFARDVDYVSGASILVPTALFRELGGFDNRYAPAYYEDTDLALQIRDRGLRVIVQPSSRVIHFEGVSSGRDEESGAKRHQARNGQLFRRKWAERLAHHAPNGENPLIERNRGRIGRLLVLEMTTPTPDQDAGSLFMFNILMSLVQLGYDVSFIAVDNLLFMPEYSSALERLGVRVLVHPHLSSVADHLAVEGGSYDGVLMARPEVAERCLEPIKSHAPHARLLYYTHDLHHLRMERQQACEPGSVTAEAIAAMRALEKEIVDVVDGVLYLSEAEKKEAEERLAPRSLGYVLPPVVEGEPGPKGFAQRSGVVFIGGFGHPPNRDAVLWFVSEVMPRLRAAGADITFHVVGANPPQEVLDLAGPDVEIHGYLADLDPFLGDRRLAVAPLRYGAGVKGKMLTAMAAGLPVVASSVAAEGLSLRHGVNVLKADEAEAVATAVLDLYRSQPLWEEVRQAALSHALQGWGGAACRQALWRICAEVGLPVPPDGAELGEALTYRPDLVRRLGGDELLAFYNLRQMA